MFEINPRIDFQEDILEISQRIPTNYSPERLKLKQTLCEEISLTSGYYAEMYNNEMILRANIPKILYSAPKSTIRISNVQHLLQNLRYFTTYIISNTSTDNVFTLKNTNPMGNVSAQFQKYLNSGSLSETVAREAIRVMSLPFGKDETIKALRKFVFNTDGMDTFAGSSDHKNPFSISSRRSLTNLTILDYESKPNKKGRASWNFLNINNNNSAFGVDINGISNNDLIATGRVNNLYDMQGHNIRSDHQKLSLILGTAVIAAAASRFTGTDDIYESVEW